ncbi:hypothetical protein U1740_09425 [Aeromonas caviae]|uniref:hypothetical protein n=2 Tax=Aeromonas caviae TaxID=648 RepID=UPI003014FB2D
MVELAQIFINCLFPCLNQAPYDSQTTINLWGERHGSDACYLAGEKQRTGGCNSGAVALPTLAITDSFTVSLYRGHGRVKQGGQADTFKHQRQTGNVLIYFDFFRGNYQGRAELYGRLCYRISAAFYLITVKWQKEYILPLGKVLTSHLAQKHTILNY